MSRNETLHLTAEQSGLEGRSRQSLVHEIQQLRLRIGKVEGERADIRVLRAEDEIARDVSERKKAEQELRKLAAVVQNSSELVNLADLDGTMVFLNEAGLEMLGLSPDDVKRTNIMQVIPDPLQDKVRREVLPRLLKRGAWEGDLQYVNLKTGRLTDVHATTFTINDPNSEQPLYLANVSLDITERKQAADALLQSERKYRELADSLPSSIFETDLDGRLTFANRTAFAWFGYTEADLSARMNVLNMVAEPDRPRAGFSFQRVLGAGETSSGEYQVRRKDGTTFYALIVARAIVKDGRTAGLQGIVIDISDRKKAETALQESETTLQAFINAIPDPAFLLDRDYVALVVNRAFAERFRKRGEDIIGKVIFDLLPADLAAQRKAQISRVFQTKKPAHFEDVRLDSSYINYVYPIFDTRGDVARVAVFALDISQRKHVENELQKTTANLRETLGSLINVVATTVEVRDPYTSGHQKRVSNLARAIATEMALPKNQVEGIRVAGVIHDIGKISIPSEILSKPGKLSSLESAMIKSHSQIGYEILKDIKFPWPVAQIVYQHHERMNGSGYPRRLKGKDILLEARILAVADVMEAMSSHRPYRSALGSEKALEELSRNKGILYDADVVDACVKIFSSHKFKFEAE